MRIITFSILVLLFSLSFVTAQTVDYRAGVENQVVQINGSDVLNILLSDSTKLKVHADQNTSLVINSIKKQNFTSLPQTTWNQTTLNSIILQSFYIDIQDNQAVYYEMQTDFMLLNTGNLLSPTLSWYSKQNDAWVKLAGPFRNQDKAFVLAGYSPIINVITQQTSVSCPSIDISKFNVTVAAPTTTFPESVLCNNLPDEVKNDLVQRVVNGMKSELSYVPGKLDSISSTQQIIIEKTNTLEVKSDSIINITNQSKEPIFGDDSAPYSLNSTAGLIIGIILLAATIFALFAMKKPTKKKGKSFKLPYLGAEDED